MQKKSWFWLGGAIIAVLIIIALASSLMIQRTETSTSNRGGAMMMESAADFGFAQKMAGAPVPMADDRMGSEEPAGQAAADRLIIKTGTLTMVVEDVAAAIEKINNYATGKGGFVVTSNISKQGVAPQGSIAIRIPVAAFDAGFEEIKGFGDVQQQTVQGQDVTEEYVDLESQLKNLQATEAQFLEIMKQAVKIPDILEVQRELTIVRGQIESIQGQMKYLKQSAAMSTLTVYLSTDPTALPVIEAEDKWKPLGVIKDAFRSLIEVVKVIANILIWLIIFIPLWAIIGLVIWLIRRNIKRKK